MIFRKMQETLTQYADRLRAAGHTISAEKVERNLNEIQPMHEKFGLGVKRLDETHPGNGSN